MGRLKYLTEVTSNLIDRIEADTAYVSSQEDFLDLAPPEAINEAFQLLVENGTLIPIGEALYAKARLNRLTGEPMFAAPGGFDQVAKAALDRLGVRWEPGAAERDYQRGGTQVPVRTVVRITEGHRPSIGYKRYRLLFEQSKKSSTAL